MNGGDGLKVISSWLQRNDWTKAVWFENHSGQTWFSQESHDKQERSVM